MAEIKQAEVTKVGTSQPSLQEKLCKIQNEMHVPKNLYNSFGKYSYRNAETILETAKPICLKNRTTLLVSDDIVQIGDRIYVKATAKLCDWDTGEAFLNSALAREADTKRGMDASQITGSSSSYARKYALNGLFCLDDVKDSDATENTKEREEKAKEDLLINLSKVKSEMTRYKIDYIENRDVKNFVYHLLTNNGVEPIYYADGKLADNLFSNAQLDTLIKTYLEVIKKFK